MSLSCLQDSEASSRTSRLKIDFPSQHKNFLKELHQDDSGRDFPSWEAFRGELSCVKVAIQVIDGQYNPESLDKLLLLGCVPSLIAVAGRAFTKWNPFVNVGQEQKLTIPLLILVNPCRENVRESCQREELLEMMKNFKLPRNKMKKWDFLNCEFQSSS